MLICIALPIDHCIAQEYFNITLLYMASAKTCVTCLGCLICICVFVFVYCKCIVYCQCKTVCDLRLLSRLSDLNGQIPSPLSQTFLTHDDDGHHDDDVGHHDGDGDNGAKITQL